MHKSCYFYKMVKRWRTGLIAQDTPQPPIGGTQYVLNHFAGDPTYDEDACRQLIRKHVRHRTWNTTTPTYEEYLRCLRAPKNKSAGPDGVPPHLLRHLPDHVQRQLYQAIVAAWNGQHIPVAWLQSRVVLIYKKKNPQDPQNYRPIYVSTAIYSILTRLLLTRISGALTPGPLDIPHGTTQGRNTTTLATKLLNDLHVEDGYVALLDVAKAFPSVPRPMLTGIVKEAGAPENIIRMLGEIYQHTPAVLTLHGKDLPIRPTRGMKEGCPLSPTLFLLYYDILLRETMERCPGARLYVFVDDIAVRAPTKEALLHTLDTLHDVAHTMGLHFNKDKSEVCHWAKDYDLTPITWRHQLIPVRPPIMTYLGHVLAHPTQEDTAWDMVTTQLHHDVAAYRTLPLNAYEKVAIINAVLIPRWTYRGLFLGNRTRMAHWDDILLQFIRHTPGVEQQMNKHRLTTNLSHGGLGLRQLWWSYITRWVTIGPQELQRTGPTQQLTATQYKYIDAIRALGGTVGQRISQPRQHRPLSAGLYDSESSEEDQETHAGKTRPATNRLDYSWMNPPEEPTPEETQEVCQALPHQQKLHGITIHYTGEPTTTRWYTDGSKRHGRAGGGIYNGTYRAAFRVHGPQQVYRAETIACALASELAKPGDDIILDNQSVVKATPIKRKGVVKDQDYRDIGYLNSTTKRLTIRWTPRHRNLEQATTYKDYQDIQGNNHSDVLANMGDNLPMDSQQPQPHDIVITGHIMPTPAKAWIMQVRRQKQTPDVHWVSWLPMKHYRRNAWTPWLWGQVRWWGMGAPWERTPRLCSQCGHQHGALVQSNFSYCPAWSDFWDLWRKSWTDWAPYTHQWLQAADNQELWLCVRLLIPLSLVDAIPTAERHKLRAEVGLFQFRMIQSVQTPRRKYADPTPQQPPSPLWLTKYMAQALPPRETPQNLRNQVGAPTWCGAKRKRKAEVATADPIDPGQWLQDARSAGDSEAVAWFVARATNTGADDHIKKRQRLNVDTQRWEQYKTTTERLANEHAQQARDIYHKAHMEVMARQHLHTLHMGYTDALTAKTDYHRLVIKLVDQQRQTQRLHDTHAHLYQIRRQWYEQAKDDTRMWYTDAKLLLMVNDRYWRLSAGTAKLLDLHHQQATYM